MAAPILFPPSPDDDVWVLPALVVPPSLPPTPPTSPDTPVIVKPRYFTGSDKAATYLIDLDADPEDQPPDVKAYLECVARSDSQHADPANTCPPQHLPPTPSPIHPYRPSRTRVARGLAILRAQYGKAPGIWVTPGDITERDMEDWPHYPWLGPVLRNQPQVVGLSGGGDGARAHTGSVILGNVRLGWPDTVEGPRRNPHWLALTRLAYGIHHPARIAAARPWYTDEHINEWLRWQVAGVGCPFVPEPQLPPDPATVGAGEGRVKVQS